MRSGTSYFNLTVFRKHLTRFWPIWTAWLVVLLLVLPVRGLMALREDGAGMEGRLAWFARSIPDLTSSGFTLVMAVLVGLLAAMAACSHLYSTRSANFMGALPVRREGLFFSHYLAGLAMVLGPVLAASLLTLLVELAGGALELLPLGYWLGYACSAGFFFYSFAVFLGMFTGHLLALPAFYLIFNFLVMAVVGLVEWALRSFYYGFGSLPDWLYDGMQWCTPVMRYTYVQLVGRPQELFYGTTLWVYPIVAAAGSPSSRSSPWWSWPGPPCCSTAGAAWRAPGMWWRCGPCARCSSTGWPCARGCSWVWSPPSCWVCPTWG